MNEPMSLLLAKIERQLGLVRPWPQRVDPDCPSPDVLEWLADIDPLYDTLPSAPPLPDAWPATALRINQTEQQALRGSIAFWRAATAALSIICAICCAALWHASRPIQRAATASPATAEIRTAPAAPPLIATLREVSSGDQTLFVLVANPLGAAIHSTPAEVALHPGHTYHLWVDAGSGFVLMGAVSPSISHSLSVPAAYRKQVRLGSRVIVTLDPGTQVNQLARQRVVARGQLKVV